MRNLINRKKGAGMEVRLIEAVKVVALPGVVVLRVASTDDTGMPRESALGELSIEAAIDLAQNLIDEAVRAMDFADAMPPDNTKKGYRA